MEVESRSCFLGTILRHPGERADPSPGGRSPRSPLAELGTAPVHSAARHRAAVWVGRGATATPREAEWIS